MNDTNDKDRKQCEEMDRLLARMVFGELDGDSPEDVALREHVDQCDACRELLGDMRVTAGLMTEAVASSPKPKLGKVRRKKMREAVCSGRHPRKISLLTAALLILCFSGFLALLLMPGDGSTACLGVSSKSARQTKSGEQLKGVGTEVIGEDILEKANNATDRWAEPPLKGKEEYKAVKRGRPSPSLSSESAEVAKAEPEMVPLEIEYPKPLFAGTPAEIKGVKNLEPKDTIASLDKESGGRVGKEKRYKLGATMIAKAILDNSSLGHHGTAYYDEGGGRAISTSRLKALVQSETEFDESNEGKLVILSDSDNRYQVESAGEKVLSGKKPAKSRGSDPDKDGRDRTRKNEQAKLPQEAEKQRDDSQKLPPSSNFRMMPVNPFVMTAMDHFSTFAIDVDTASYELAKRYIRSGYKPPPGSVRMEEYINSFDYNYPDQSARAFTIHAEIGKSPFRPKYHMIKVGVKARTIGRENHRPAHLVFLIDTSGSMKREDRLPVVKKTLRTLTAKLSKRDRVSIVTYSDKSRLVVEATPASDRSKLVKAIDSIQAGGYTNITDGLKLGIQVARQYFKSGNINSIILCSDGIANVGETEAGRILGEVEKYRRQGITQNSAGFGSGSYNDTLMEQLANRGDGQYMYVDSSTQSQKTFISNLSAAIRTVGRDAKIQVAFNKNVVRKYRLIGYENRDIADKDFRNDAVDAGEVGSGQHATALYEVEFFEKAYVAGNSRNIGTVHVRYKNDRLGEVEEIASVAAFLASEGASFMTGETIIVDGGFGIRKE